jgi:hypothetical protein
MCCTQHKAAVDAAVGRRPPPLRHSFTAGEPGFFDAPCENTVISQHGTKLSIMDAEHINTIGSKLSDLAARTLDLRGYL